MSRLLCSGDFFERLERAIALNEDRDWAASPADAYLYAVVIGWSSANENPLEALLALARRHGWTLDYVRQILEDRAAYREAKAQARALIEEDDHIPAHAVSLR